MLIINFSFILSLDKTILIISVENVKIIKMIMGQKHRAERRQID